MKIVFLAILIVLVSCNENDTSEGFCGNLVAVKLTRVVNLELELPVDSNGQVFNATGDIFDSLGNAHLLTLQFESYGLNMDGNNYHWEIFAQIDGENVGDPNTALAPPGNAAATEARFDLWFGEEGNMNNILTAPMLVSNWLPLNEFGAPNGALGPLNVLQGGTIPIPDVPSSSNFELELNAVLTNRIDIEVIWWGLDNADGSVCLD